MYTHSIFFTSLLDLIDSFIERSQTFQIKLFFILDNQVFSIWQEFLLKLYRFTL